MFVDRTAQSKTLEMVDPNATMNSSQSPLKNLILTKLTNSKTDHDGNENGAGFKLPDIGMAQNPSSQL